MIVEFYYLQEGIDKTIVRYKNYSVHLEDIVTLVKWTSKPSEIENALQGISLNQYREGELFCLNPESKHYDYTIFDFIGGKGFYFKDGMRAPKKINIPSGQNVLPVRIKKQKDIWKFEYSKYVFLKEDKDFSEEEELLERAGLDKWDYFFSTSVKGSHTIGEAIDLAVRYPNPNRIAPILVMVDGFKGLNKLYDP